MTTLSYSSYSREYPPLPQLVPPSPGSFYPSPGPSSAAEKSSLPSLEFSQVGPSAPVLATSSTSYSSPPLTATTAPSQTLPTPPTSENEIPKTFPITSAREEFAGSISSQLGPQIGVAEPSAPSSAMLSRRQNATLPAFTLPNSNTRSFSFSTVATTANAPSLLTPPSLSSENMSPIQSGTPNLYSNAINYWSQPTPSPSAYSFASTSGAPQNSYSTASSVPSTVSFSSRSIYSPTHSTLSVSRDRPSSPTSADSSTYEGSNYNTSVMSPQGSVVTGAVPQYAAGYPFQNNTSTGGPGSPHDQFPSTSSLPPPTPQPAYPQSYSYSTSQTNTGITSPHRPSTSTGIPQLHPQPIHPAPPTNLTGGHLLQGRFLPGVPIPSSGLISPHANHLLTGSGHSLGPALPHPHLHHTHHGSHSTPQQDRPFKCDQCPQSFNRNHDLKRHRRIHLAVKPFPCPHCDKSFSRKDALKRHVLVKGCGASTSNSTKSTSGNIAPTNREPSPRQNVSSGAT